MFKFNFNNDEDSSDNEKEMTTLPVIEAKEFIPENIVSTIKLELEKHSKNVTKVSEIKLISSPLFEYKSIQDIAHTDLKPNVYEGGYKLWECSFDLMDYIKNNLSIDNQSVLDLGCGTGLLGLYTLLHGASQVSFQDYNIEVIESLTLPNILLNKEDLSQCKLYYGDWSSLHNVVHSKFDIILSSETIYSVINYDKLISVFKTLLKPTGCVYLAAKVYYFGVGGCIYDFEKLLEENGFVVKTVWEQNEGVKRKIIQIQFQMIPEIKG